MSRVGQAELWPERVYPIPQYPEPWGMHLCGECGAWFDDAYLDGSGWDPGMAKPCCGGTGAWSDPIMVGRAEFILRERTPKHRYAPVEDPEAAA